MSKKEFTFYLLTLIFTFTIICGCGFIYYNNCKNNHLLEMAKTEQAQSKKGKWFK